MRGNAEITLVCREGVGQLFKQLEVVDRVFEVKKGNSESYKAVQKSLELEEFEWVLCPHQSFTSAWFQRRIRAQQKISFGTWWNAMFFSDLIKKPMHLPEALRQMSLLKNVDPELGFLLSEYNEPTKENELGNIPPWATSDIDVKKYANAFAAEREKLGISSRPIVLFPGSAWETKRWTESGFIELVKYYSKQGNSVVILGSSAESILCERIAASQPGAISLAGKTSLFETVAILASAQIVFCNDSAGQHLASMVSTPTVSIFGPTVLSQGFRPWSNSAAVAQLEGLQCRPCGRHGHRQCPIGTHDCMVKLEASQVLAKANLIQVNPSNL